MGIKDLWEVIDPAERKFSLEELATHCLKRRGASDLRIAIDVALWAFQARSAKGGK